MGLTPTTPNFNTVAKNFWQRREGTAGKVVLAVLIAGLITAGVLTWGLVLPFLIGVMGNTLQLALLVAALIVLTSPIWDRKMGMLVSMAYQQTIRWGYGMFVQIDPIGILRTNITQLKEKAEVFAKSVESLSGAKQRIEDDIAEQKQGVMENKRLAEATDRAVAKLFQQQSVAKGQEAEAIGIKISQLGMQKHNYAQNAGFQLSTIKQEQPLLDKANDFYNKLTRLQMLAESKVEGLSQQADMMSKRRRMIQDTTSALKSAWGILKGDPNQLALIDQTVEFLNDEASSAIGALNDFSRWSDKYLTNMDIQNDAAADEGMKIFANLEQKLALPSPAGASVNELTAMPDFDSPEIQKLLK